MNNKKHAYLLMLHHRKDLVDLLLEELDDERNDLYIHIDSSSSELNINDFNIKKSKVYEVASMMVVWGDFSQIECELRLMKKASENGPYAYYHFMQGSAFPLKNQDDLHKFYDDNQGKQFISVEDYKLLKYRVDQYNLLAGYYSGHGKWVTHLNMILVKIQRLLGISRLKKHNLVYAKGFALWSVTDDLLKYVLSKENLIRDLFKYSLCGDEIFIHMLAYNSDFREDLYDYGQRFTSAMWASTWEMESDFNLVREGHNFKYEDLDYLMKQKANFARKFEGNDGIKLIKEIKRIIHEK